MPTMAWTWSGVGIPEKAVKASPPAFFATLSQSIRRKMSLAASPVLVRSGRFSMRPVTTPSIRAILASLEALEPPAVELETQDFLFTFEAGFDHLQHARLAGPPVAMHANGYWLIRSIPEQPNDSYSNGLVIKQVNSSFVVWKYHLLRLPVLRHGYETLDCTGYRGHFL